MVLIFESDELEQTEAFLNTHYGPMRIDSTTRDARARLARTNGGGVNIDRVDFDFEMSYAVEPLGRISLCDIHSGEVSGHAPEGERSEDFGPGDLVSYSPPDRPYAGTINRATYTFTMIDTSVLDLVASPARGESSVRLTGHRPVSKEAAQSLRAAIDHLDRYVLVDPVASANPLVMGAAVRYVGARLLATFPNTSTWGPSRPDSRDAHPKALRRAIAYIEAYADADISPADIAAAAHVSVRSVQLAFRRHLDTTPMTYLRDVRLARVRADLEAASPEETTVAAVAARWGFVHLGRFGEIYKQAFGETPGATLRS